MILPVTKAMISQSELKCKIKFKGEIMKNKLVIFDCFGVIMGDVAPVFLKKFLPDEVAKPLKEKLFVPAD